VAGQDDDGDGEQEDDDDALVLRNFGGSEFRIMSFLSMCESLSAEKW
jgi:hypothetical protein